MSYTFEGAEFSFKPPLESDKTELLLAIAETLGASDQTLSFFMDSISSGLAEVKTKAGTPDAYAAHFGKLTGREVTIIVSNT